MAAFTELLGTALELLRQGSHAEAAALCRAVLARQPAQAEAACLLGVVHSAAARPDAAADAFRRAIASKPDLVDAYRNLALLRADAGDLAAARQYYRRVLALAPADEAAALALATLLEREGDLDAARAPLLAVLRHHPASRAGHLGLARLCWLLGRPDAAADWLRRGVEAAPGDLELREQYVLHCTHRAGQAYIAGLDSTPWCDRALTALAAAPRITARLYAQVEELIRLCLAANARDLALDLLRLRNAHDFPELPTAEIDVFAVSRNDFAGWCAAAALPHHLWLGEAQPVTREALDALPAYLRPHAEALTRPDVTRVGVALDADVEVLQGFYVKDNYECFVLAGRRHLLHETADLVVHGPTVPVVGHSPEARSALCRIPRPRYRRVEVDEPCLFLPSSPNYWHFLVDVLPRLLVRERMPDLKALPIHLFDLRAFHHEMLALAGVDPDRIVDLRHRVGPDDIQILYRFHRACLPSAIPYAVAYRWLRERFLPQVPPTADPRRIYLTRRGSAPKHRIANDADVGALLEGHGFETLQPERLTVRETVALVAGAEIVVAPIGAGTANHMFMPPGCTWIHLANPDFFHPASVWNAQMGTQISLVGTARHLRGRFVADGPLPPNVLDRLDVPVEIDLAALDRLVSDVIRGSSATG
ncbi:MAG TPA: glycosyltransferase 61 family protein [Azospirillaceae bacterium]|nr:glycosyltransferase 61 family protein [Azospirillaceae bacterium]